MKNKILFINSLLLLMFCMSVNVSYASSNNQDIYSIYLTTVQSSVIPSKRGDVSITAEKKEIYYGFGFSYNRFRMDYSPYFEGYKASIYGDILKDSFATPYLGVSYIGGNDDRYFRTNKQELNGTDFVLGASINFFNIIKPYAEYRVYNFHFNYGVMIHIPVKVNRKNKIN